MSDIAVTAANVQKTANTKYRTRFALEAITAGQSLYGGDVSVNVGKYDADDTAKNVLSGIALNGAAIGQPVVEAYGGDVVIGGTVISGMIYLGSDTAGGIRPSADANAGDKISILGVGKSATTISLNINNSGATV